jgi:phosphate transport system permease protein
MSQAISPIGIPPSAPGDTRLALMRPGQRWLNADSVLSTLSLCATLTVFGMLLALVIVLVHGSLPSLKTFGFSFLTTSDWRTQPTVARDAEGKILHDAAGKLVRLPGHTYGALAVIYGTTVTAVIALILAVPPSFAAAIFLIRIAPRWLAGPASFLIEFLAAIPSLAYGLWGMFVLRPLLRDWLEPGLAWISLHVPGLKWIATNSDGSGMILTGNDLLAGGLILAIMIIPIITAISRDILRSVPRAQIEGVLALGATWWQGSMEMLKYSRSGLFGAVMLGLARAAGETMAVTMVIGITTQIHPSPFAPAQTMSSLLAVSFGEVSDELEASSLVEVALILLLMSLIFNVVARYLVVGKSSARPA